MYNFKYKVRQAILGQSMEFVEYREYFGILNSLSVETVENEMYYCHFIQFSKEYCIGKARIFRIKI